MKTKKRLLYITCGGIIIFLLLGFGLERLISVQINSLLEKKLGQNKIEIEKLVLLESSTIKNYVNENSYWDELCKALKLKDTAWISENMTAPLKTPNYNADFLLLIDTAGNLIYEKNLKVDKKPFKVDTKLNSVLYNKITSTILGNYFLEDNDRVIQLHTASIVRGNDYFRKERPSGYLLVGKIIDSSYLKKLHELNVNFDYSFATQKSSIKDYVSVKEARITFRKSLVTLNNKTFGIIVTSYLPEIFIYSKYVKYLLISYLVIVALIIILLFRYFLNYFFAPLEKVINALQIHSVEPLKNIKEKNTELGSIAKMIEAYFEQNILLNNEITQRKKSEQDLTVALDEIQKSTIDKIKAEQSEAAKTEFLSTMSHEIRTPINGVIGIANLLKDEKLTGQQKEYVDVLHFSATHLLSLVSDILDFSKIESGKVDFEKNSFDLNKICSALYQLHKFNADEKKLEFNYIPDLSLKQSIYGDYVRLNQVLTNLIGNAIKFTNKGSISFSYNVMAETDNNCTIQFKIKDTGIGILQKEQQQVFDGFSQANKNISKDFGGTGLGLTICKKLVEMQGGKINVVSEFGKGSEFIFYISFEKHAYTAINTDVKLPLSKNNFLNGMKVLVAEDNNINILVIKRFLEKWGISYKIAITGNEALRMVNNEIFDLILMDLHMPEMDGEDATKIIRNNPDKKINTIPIIALTANASSDTQNKLLNNGFTNYISKPFNPDNLFKVLKKYYNEN